MSRWVADHPETPKGLLNPSLAPVDLAGGVSLRTHVRMVTGSNDTVVLLAPTEAYAQALKARGIDIQLTIVPGAGHTDVLSTSEVRQAVSEVITLEGGAVRAPAQ
jgi:acetyl esterase/lipase